MPAESFQKKFHRVKYVPLRVNELTIEGLGRTRRHIIEREMKAVRVRFWDSAVSRMRESGTLAHDLREIFRFFRTRIKGEFSCVP